MAIGELWQHLNTSGSLLKLGVYLFLPFCHERSDEVFSVSIFLVKVGFEATRFATNLCSFAALLDGLTFAFANRDLHI